MSRITTDTSSANMHIGQRSVGPGRQCYVIAEIGSNHNGDFATAEKLVRACAAAGADAVKFQAFTREGLFIPRLPQAESSAEEGNQALLQKRWDLLPSYTADPAWWPRLKALCDELGIDFACSPFSLEAVDQLDRVGSAFLKIASGDITWLELIRAAARTGRPLVMSTGASELAEVDSAVTAAREAGCTDLALLHCVSNYPPKWEDSNLRAIETLTQRYGLPSGLSDHSPGAVLPVASLALGSAIVEKHVTLDRSQPGLDHHFALEPDDLSHLVRSVRAAETALGTGEKSWTNDEEIERYWVRRGLWVVRPIKRGVVIQRKDIACLRPLVGLSAGMLDDVVGKTAEHDLPRYAPISMSDVVLSGDQ